MLFRSSPAGEFEAALELELDLSTLLVVNDGSLTRQFDVQGIPFATTSGTLRVSPPSGALSLVVDGDIEPISFQVPGLGSVDLTVSGSVRLGLAERVFVDGFELGSAVAWSQLVPGPGN